MLDDVHELRSPACHDVLSVVVSGIPPGSQLVAASRFEQPYLARLRAAGDALEILAADLALDADQARQIFSSARVSLTPEEAAAVTARTEGWPVGLHLAALIARDGGGDPAAITGDDRYVSDYLYREALGRQPEGMQRFLRRTAVLDQVSAPLCDAVLDESGSQRWLRDIEAAGLFLVPLDRRREWFRYHALFREFLLGELRRVEPDVIPKLHLRAADWYEANGSPALALEHLLNTTERERCIQLVTQLTYVFFQAGPDFDGAAVAGHARGRRDRELPPLAVLAEWILVYTGHTTEAERWAEFIEGAAFDQRARRRVGVVRLGAGHGAGRDVPRRPGTDGAGRELRGVAGAASSPWRDTALLVGAEAALLVGDDDAGGRPVRGGSPLARAMANTDCFVLAESELAALAMDRGRWAEAAGHATRRWRPWMSIRCRTTRRAFRLHRRGPAALHRGDLTAADRQLTRAMRARPICTYAHAVARRAGAAGARQGLLGARRTDDGAAPAPGDRRHPAPPAGLGVLVDEVSAFRGIDRRRGRRGGRRAAAEPGGAAAAAVPADPPDDPGDR